LSQRGGRAVDGESKEDAAERLIARIQSGEDQSFDRLFQSYRGEISALAQAMLPRWLRREIDPDDAAQEIWLRALRRIGSFRPRGKGSFRKWISTIARNCVIDLERRHRAARRKSPSIALHPGSPPMGKLLERIADTAQAPPLRLTEREAGERVRALLAGLPHTPRRILELRYIEGLSVEKTAAALGMTGPAVKMAASRAIRRLARSAQEDGKRP
jgi:RNA polymerase sigma-70 factor, ECF subfamily